MTIRTCLAAAAIALLFGCADEVNTPTEIAESEEAAAPTAIADIDLAPLLGADAPATDAAAEPSPPQMPSTPAEEIPEVVARIDDEEITREDYLRALADVERFVYARYMLVQDTTGRKVDVPPLTSQQRQLLLSNVIDRRIKLDLAEAAGIEATEEEVTARINRGLENLESAENFEEYLAYYGKTEEELRAELAETIREEKFEAQLAEGCTATDEAVAAEYARLKEAGQLDGPEQTDFWHILVRVEPGADEAAWQTAEAKINEAYVRVTEGGEDFVAVAREVSEDPAAQRNDSYLSDIPPNLMAPAVETQLKEMEPGEISEPVRTSYGFHVLKLDEYRPAGTRSLDQVRDLIEEGLLAQCRQKAVAERVAAARAERDVEVYYRPLLQSPEGTSPNPPILPAQPQ